MALLSELWNSLPSPLEILGWLTQGFFNLSQWFKEEYRGTILVAGLAAGATCWVALRRR